MGRKAIANAGCVLSAFIRDPMRSYSQDSVNLSDPLPFPHSFQYPAFAVVPMVGDIVSSLPLPSPTLPSHATYRELATFFRQQPSAIGVLIAEQPGDFAASHGDATSEGEGDRPLDAPLRNWLLGMVSRQRLMQWRSHRSRWRQHLHQRLSDVADWWQETQDYLFFDHQLPLQNAIDRLLATEVATALTEPIVIRTPAGAAVCDRPRLFAAYARLARSEQIAWVEPAVENLRRQQQLILNAIGEGVYGVDLQGNATFVNPAAAKMVGWDPQELIGKSMHQLLHHSRPNRSPYPREECPIYAAFQDGVIHRVSEEAFWRKDGTCFPVEYISTPMRDEQGNLVGAVIAFRDITQRKWAEAVLHRTNEELEHRVRDRTFELQQANEQLKELSELRSRVVTMVCHEFRNPLNNILLSVSSLGRYNAQLSADQKSHYLLGIQDNVERMTQMIDAILIIGRVEAKGIEVQPRPFDLIAFCQELVAEIALDATDDSRWHRTAERLQFATRFKRLPVTLDQRLLRSILTNILINAIRYTPEPGTIQFRVSKQNHQVLFQITDQGIGIPSEDLPYLFEPFHRGRNVSNIAGTGLGLNIVKRFVELQGGCIEASSQLGHGTTFQVILPIHYEADLIPTTPLENS